MTGSGVKKRSSAGASTRAPATGTAASGSGSRSGFRCGGDLFRRRNVPPRRSPAVFISAFICQGLEVRVAGLPLIEGTELLVRQTGDDELIAADPDIAEWNGK